MSDLTVIEPNASGWVNARELHKALGLKTKYADWVKRNLSDNKAIKGIDYNIFQSIENRGPLGQGRPGTEYMISAFLAEHFAMACQTESGHKIREVYIKCRLAVGLLKAELAQVRGQRDALLKPKRIRDNGVTYVSVPKEHTEVDIFGLSHTFYRNVRVPLDAATDAELMDYRNKHRDKVVAGIVQNQIKDNDKSVVIPFERRLKAGKEDE